MSYHPLHTIILEKCSRNEAAKELITFKYLSGKVKYFVVQLNGQVYMLRTKFVG